jgi:hypothetical protein
MKEFREFLEKRWWQGIGGITGIAALVLVVLQFLGIVHISGIAVSIALNIIFATVLVVLIVWGTKWKRKYQRVSSWLEETKGFLEKQDERIKALQETLKEVKERKRVFLPDPNNVSKLNIDNALLSELYGQAYGRAVNKYHDAKLSGLAILVHPYDRLGDRVAIHFNFYSQWASRVCTFMIGEMGDMVESLPDRPAHMFEKATFDELPWIQDQNWPQFLKKSCEKAGSLPSVPQTEYMLSADTYGKFRWGLSFKDGVTGKTSDFDWDGVGEPIPRGEFG